MAWIGLLLGRSPIFLCIFAVVGYRRKPVVVQPQRVVNHYASDATAGVL